MIVDADEDDQGEPGVVSATEYEPIEPQKAKLIRQDIIHSVPCYEDSNVSIHLRNPLAVIYLQPNSPSSKNCSRNHLIEAIQLEHCKGRGSVIKGGLLVIELSADQSDEIVNLPYEHVKYMELVLALCIPNIVTWFI